MTDEKIIITSNSTNSSIKNDFEKCQNVEVISISLDILVDKEEEILNLVVEQINKLHSLQKLAIIFTQYCIVEKMDILSKGISQLNQLKSLSIHFEDDCNVSEQIIQSLTEGIKMINQLAELNLVVKKYNKVNLKAINQIKDCIVVQQNLSKLSLEIQIFNKFNNEYLVLISEALLQCKGIKELVLNIEFNDIQESTLSLFSSAISGFNNLVLLYLNFESGNDKLIGIDHIFYSIGQQKKLKNLKLSSSYQKNIETKDIESLNKCLSQLINLVEIKIDNLYEQRHQNIQQVKAFSKLINLTDISIKLENFNQNNPDELQTVGDIFSKFNQLTKISLQINDHFSDEKNHIVYQLASCFKNWQQLQHLELKCDSNIPFQDSLFFVEQMRNLSSLQSLTLNFTQKFDIRKEGVLLLGQTFESLTQLQTLALTFIQQQFQDLHFGNIFKNLKHLRNLLSLTIYLSEEIKNQDILQLSEGLHYLENLKYFNFQSIILKITEETLQSFSNAIKKLDKLTHLQTFFFEGGQIYQSSLFETFNFLINLSYIELKVYLTLTNHSSEEFGSGLSQLSQLEVFKLDYQNQCKLIHVQNITQGLSNPKLKKLCLDFQEIFDNDNYNNQNDFDLFKSMKKVETIKIAIQASFSTQDLYLIFFNSLKQLNNINKLTINFGQSLKLTNNGLKSVRDFLQSQQNLLHVSLSLGKEQINQNLDEGIDQLYEGILSLKKVQYLFLRCYIQEVKITQIVDSIKELRNLRFGDINFYQNGEYQNKIKQQEQNQINSQIDLDSIPKYLSNLKMSLSLPNQQYKQKYIDQIKVIKYCKYLNSFQLIVNEDHKLKNKELLELGQSLQNISNINNISIKIYSTFNLRKEALVEFSKGLQCQVLLTELQLRILNQVKIDREGFCALMKAIKYLNNLLILNLLVKQNDIFNDESLVALGDSLLNTTELTELQVDITRNSSEFIDLDNGFISIGKSFKNLIKLKAFYFRMNNNIVFGEKGGIEFAKGIGQLANLQILNLFLNESGQLSHKAGLEIANSLCNLRNLHAIDIMIGKENGLKSDIMNSYMSSIQMNPKLKNITLELSVSDALNKNPFEIVKFLDLKQRVDCTINFTQQQDTFLCNLQYRQQNIYINASLEKNNVYNAQEIELIGVGLGSLSIKQNIVIKINQNCQLSSSAFSRLSESFSQLNCKQFSLYISGHQQLKQSVKNIFQGLSKMKNLRKLTIQLFHNDLMKEELKDSIKIFVKENNLLSLNFQFIQFGNINQSDLYEIIKEFCQIKSLQSFQFSVEYFLKDANHRNNFQWLVVKELPKLVDLQILGKEYL